MYAESVSRKRSSAEEPEERRKRRIFEKIRECGYDVLDPDQTIREAGKLAFELATLKESARKQAQSFNRSIRDVEGRLEALRVHKETQRKPPPVSLVREAE